MYNENFHKSTPRSTKEAQVTKSIEMKLFKLWYWLPSLQGYTMKSNSRLKLEFPRTRTLFLVNRQIEKFSILQCLVMNHISLFNQMKCLLFMIEATELKNL
ncbi:CLUMA_CG018350, isoform A [Clunio marinus]|uniref:CLUMA_CG018350, isoform A n=1 Tax=Clunio marinus TaxID=568069 RepID=A0A1J1IY52_9DIPT|nr:CLUMA_CG018350, isoform A [Clunio marinus]